MNVCTHYNYSLISGSQQTSLLIAEAFPCPSSRESPLDVRLAFWSLIIYSTLSQSSNAMLFYLLIPLSVDGRAALRRLQQLFRKEKGVFWMKKAKSRENVR